MYDTPCADDNSDRFARNAARMYDGLTHDPAHAYVAASYAELRRIILQQYRELSAGGFRFHFQTEDPYASSAEMLADARRGELRVYADRGETLPSDHPMREIVLIDVTRPETESWTLNDVFRGVHDVMGHTVTGANFGPEGEYRAWLAHRETMTPLALNALWCETRGQNVWTNFGYTPEHGDHSALPIPSRPYAAQKAGLVPLAYR
jgi:hypothetical protein